MIRGKVGRSWDGPAGTATEVEVEIERAAEKAALSCWFLDCPGQSLGWRHFGLSLIHLRPMPGVDDAHIRVPDATHEIMLIAFDPRANPVPENPVSWHYLTPPNLSEQFRAPSDEAAVEILELCVSAVLLGRLWAEPPLSGQVEPWRSAIASMAGRYVQEADG